MTAITEHEAITIQVPKGTINLHYIHNFEFGNDIELAAQRVISNILRDSKASDRPRRYTLLTTTAASDSNVAATEAFILSEKFKLFSQTFNTHLQKTSIVPTTARYCPVLKTLKKTDSCALYLDIQFPLAPKQQRDLKMLVDKPVIVKESNSCCTIC